MQPSFDLYKAYSSAEFAMDDYFIEWVYLPSEAHEAYWQNFLLAFPAQESNVRQAKRILLSFDVQEDVVPDEIRNRVWQRIGTAASGRKIKNLPIRKYRFAVAAAVLLIVAGAAFLPFLKHDDLQRHVAVSVPVAEDIMPGGNKALLTLSDGSVIVLDSAVIGALANEGNADVIKLADGKLAYQTEEGSTGAPMLNTIATPKGGQYQVRLSDGSRIWLNAASSITFPASFSGNEREVKIKGEAYLEVAHDNKRPFLVRVADMTVEVLGTHFNINAYEDEAVIRTTLLEGSVKVTAEGNSVLVKPGLQAQVSRAVGGTSDIAVREVNTGDVVAWKNGFFSFRHAGLKDILKQLSRWYDMEVVYEGNIEKQQFTGKIDRDLTLSEVLEILKQTGVAYKIEGKKLIILR